MTFVENCIMISFKIRKRHRTINNSSRLLSQAIKSSNTAKTRKIIKVNNIQTRTHAFSEDLGIATASSGTKLTVSPTFALLVLSVTSITVIKELNLQQLNNSTQHLCSIALTK